MVRPHANTPGEFRPNRLLVVDDGVENFSLVSRILAHRAPGQWLVDYAATGPDAIDRQAASIRVGQPYSVALVDYVMSPWDGLRTTRELWRLDDALPIVLASGAPDLDLGNVADEAGKAEQLFVLQKPFLPRELLQTLARALVAGERIQGRGAAANDRVPDGGRARVELERALGRLLQRTRRQPCALLSIGIDRLLARAGNRGNSGAADLAHQVTRAARQRLQGVRHQIHLLDVDSFAVILEDCSEPAATRIARDIVQHVERLPLSSGPDALFLTLSVGVVPVLGGGGSSHEVLLAAEVARRKAQRRGGAEIAAGRLGDTSVVRELSMARAVPEIETALQDNRLQLIAQPIIPLNGELSPQPALELLLRLRGREGRVWAPHEFMGAAEHSGLSPRIDRVVLRQALNLLPDPQLFPRIQYLAVNISAHLLADEDGLEWLERQLLEIGAPVRKLCLEITESAVLSERGGFRNFVARMATTGVRFALDDFGAGYSTFDYLQSLPIHEVKIDGSLVRGCLADPRRRELLRTVSRIARVWGKRTVAEQIEDSDTLAFVRDIGIDFAQGFFISGPLPVREALVAGERIARKFEIERT